MQLGATNWSISPDDDGLEPVQSAALLEAPRLPERTLLGMPPPPSRRPVSNPPTVVVDPESQVPSAPFFPLPDHLPIEPTQILRGRQVDRLRSQLLAQRRAHRKGMSRKLALWCVAGALAVALGAGLAALAFAPASLAPASPSTGESALSSRVGASLPHRVTLSVTPGAAPMGLRAERRDPLAPKTNRDQTVAGASPLSRQTKVAVPRSPLLESGLEPENLAADRTSPLQESGLAYPAELPMERGRMGAVGPAPDGEPEPVTLEELMRE